MRMAHATDRLLLLPWTVADLGRFHRIWSDPRVIWWGHARSRAQSARILRRAVEIGAVCPQGLGWLRVVARAGTGTVGSVFLQPSAYDDSWELGYQIVPRQRGCGLATEASRVLVVHAFRCGIERTTTMIVPDNASSHRVARKLGMYRTGTRMHAGRLHDVYERTAPC